MHTHLYLLLHIANFPPLLIMSYFSLPFFSTQSLNLLLPPGLKLALLSVSCCDSRGIQGPPSKQAIWSITCKGDIFVSEPSPSLEAMPYPTPCDQM